MPVCNIVKYRASLQIELDIIIPPWFIATVNMTKSSLRLGNRSQVEHTFNTSPVYHAHELNITRLSVFLPSKINFSTKYWTRWSLRVHTSDLRLTTRRKTAFARQSVSSASTVPGLRTVPPLFGSRALVNPFTSDRCFVLAIPETCGICVGKWERGRREQSPRNWWNSFYVL